jgi:putative FmdB family regulatory protein
MPIYEYRCESCGYQFEQFQSMRDEPLKKCPECGKKVTRIIGTGMGVIFKGTGIHAANFEHETSGGRTCCGRNERCDRPPCTDDGTCKR